MALEPEVVDSASETKADKHRRALVRYKIRRLPPDARRELDARLAAENFGSFEELSAWLQEVHHQRISPQSLSSYYRHNFDPVLKAVKLATAQATEIVKLSAGNEDLMSGALLRLVQTAIYDLLVELHRSRHLIARIPHAREVGNQLAQSRSKKGGGKAGSQEEAAAGRDAPPSTYSNRVEVAAVAALGKVTAMVGKAVIDLQRWRDEMREKLKSSIAAATAKVSEMAREGGMSAETEDKIRALLTEIKP